MAADELIDDAVDEAEELEAEGTDLEEEDPKEVLKKIIDVDVSEVGVLRRRIRVTVPRDHLDSEFDKNYKELAADAMIPGFRRGRAPRRLVEKRFGREVGEQIQSRILANAYLAAVEKGDLKVLGDPLIWVRMKDKHAAEGVDQEQLVDMRTALEHLRLPDEGDFEFRCEVEVKPEFELPELEGVPIEKPALKITAGDVKVQIDRLRARRGNWVPVEEGETVQADDLLVCDMKMSVDGREIKRLENIQVAARAQVIEGAIVEDLGEALKGARIGDTRSASATLPADYEVEDLRGTEATFEFRVNEIKRMQLPPLDATFLASRGFDNEKEYRAWVRDQMERQLEEELRRGMRNQVREYLLEKTKLDLPEGLSSRQAERAAARFRVELQRQGLPPAEIEKRADDLQTSAREHAIEQLKLFFILEEIAEKLEIRVTEEEINAQIAAMARAYNRRFDRVRDELSRNDGLASLYLELRDEKCIDHILRKAKITESKPAGKGGASGKPASRGAKAKQSADSAGAPAEGGVKKKSARKKGGQDSGS